MMKKTLFFLIYFFIIYSGFFSDSKGDDLPENISGITIGKNFGIFIGVENYKYFPKLHTPLNDIIALKKILISKYGFKRENTFELLNSQFTGENLKKAFLKLKEQMSENDTLIIFYAGHSFQDEFKESYWIPSNSKQKNEAEYFPHGLLIRMLRTIPSRHILVITDNIFSDQLTDNAPQVAKKAEELNDFNTLYSKKSRRVLLTNIQNTSASEGILNDQLLSPFMTLFTSYLKQLKKQLYFSFSQMTSDLNHYLKEKSRGNIFYKTLKASDDDNGDLFFFNTKYMMHEESKDEPKDEILVELEKVREYENQNSGEKSAEKSVREKPKTTAVLPKPTPAEPPPLFNLTHQNSFTSAKTDFSETTTINEKNEESAGTTRTESNFSESSSENTLANSTTTAGSSAQTTKVKTEEVKVEDFLYFLVKNIIVWILFGLLLAGLTIYYYLKNKNKTEAEAEPEIIYLNEFSKRIKEFEQSEFVDVRKIPQDLTSAKWCSYCQKLLSKHKTICENCTSSLFLHNFTVQFIKEFEKCPKSFCYIPAGFFYMGSDLAENEKPVREVHLSSYYISKFLVTNKDYKKFLSTSKYKEGGLFNTVFGGNQQPVVEVTWNDALKYSQWHGYNLPSEAQWEKAARGWNQKKYPWGNQEPGENYLNFNNKYGHTTDVDKFQAGASV